MKTQFQQPNKIRLIYAEFGYYEIKNEENFKFEVSACKSQSYHLPKGMDLKDACKVASFVLDRETAQKGMDEYSQRVDLTAKNLEQYGFEVDHDSKSGTYLAYSAPRFLGKIKFGIREEKDTLDLIIARGSRSVFEKFDLYNRYFKWHTKGIKKEEILDIYDKINDSEEEREIN